MGGSFRAPAKGEDPLIAALAAVEHKNQSSNDSGVEGVTDDELESKKDQ